MKSIKKNAMMKCSMVLIGLGGLVWMSLFLVIGFRNETAWLAWAFRYSYVLVCIAALLIVIGLIVYEIFKDYEVEAEKPDAARVATLLAWMEPQKRRCIIFGELPDRPVTVGCSKTEGMPDLPVGRRMPLDDEGNPLAFVAQVRCSDLTPFDPEGHYPHSGMLYFFAGFVLYCKEEEGLVPTCNEGKWNGQPIKFLEGWDFPDYSAAQKVVAKCNWSDYREARRQAGDTVRDGQLGGYYWHNDEESAEDEDQVKRSEMLFGYYDFGGLQYLIDPQDLADRIFSNARCISSH